MSKIKKDYGIRDIYQYYVKNSKKEAITFEQFCSFLYGHERANKTTNKGLIPDIKYEMINRAYSVILPHRLGILSIKKKKHKLVLNDKGEIDYVKSHMCIDFKSTKKYWENNPGSKEKGIKIYYKNDHTRGYRLTINWDKYSCIFRNKKVYKFKPVRGFNRLIAKEVKNNKSLDFYEQ